MATTGAVDGDWRDSAAASAVSLSRRGVELARLLASTAATTTRFLGPSLEWAAGFRRRAPLPGMRPGRLDCRYRQGIPLVSQREHEGFSLVHRTFDRAHDWQQSRSLEPGARAGTIVDATESLTVEAAVGCWGATWAWSGAAELIIRCLLSMTMPFSEIQDLHHLAGAVFSIVSGRPGSPAAFGWAVG